MTCQSHVSPLLKPFRNFYCWYNHSKFSCVVLCVPACHSLQPHSHHLIPTIVDFYQFLTNQTVLHHRDFILAIPYAGMFQPTLSLANSRSDFTSHLRCASLKKSFPKSPKREKIEFIVSMNKGANTRFGAIEYGLNIKVLCLLELIYYI